MAAKTTQPRSQGKLRNMLGTSYESKYFGDMTDRVSKLKDT